MTQREGDDEQASPGPTVEEMAQQARESGDPSGWFDAFYRAAGRDPKKVPWAELSPNPYFLAWATEEDLDGSGQDAVVVGCGLGDDAAALAEMGFAVTGFDISEEAIRWCRRRFKTRSVAFAAADLFRLPSRWQRRFDFVLEIYTLQALPPAARQRAARAVAELVAPGGRLLVVCRGRKHGEPLAQIPWPLSRKELETFTTAGLVQERFDDFIDDEGLRSFRIVYRRPAGPS